MKTAFIVGTEEMSSTMRKGMLRQVLIKWLLQVEKLGNLAPKVDDKLKDKFMSP